MTRADRIAWEIVSEFKKDADYLKIKAKIDTGDLLLSGLIRGGYCETQRWSREDIASLGVVDGRQSRVTVLERLLNVNEQCF